MAFDFPNSPTEGQEYVAIVSGMTYVFKSGKWMIKAGDAPADGKVYGRKDFGWAETVDGVAQDTRDDAQEAAIALRLTDAPSDGSQYVRKNAAWAPVSVPPGTAISDTPPGSPAPGQLWFESDSGNLYIWYADANSTQWVQINGPGVPVIAIGDAPPASPLHGQMWWQSSTGKLLTFYNDGNSSAWVQVGGPAAVKPGEWVLLDSRNAAGLPNVDFDYETTGWPTGYDQFKIEGLSVLPVTGTGTVYPFIRVKIGGAWLNTGGAYNWNLGGQGNSGTYVGEGATMAGVNLVQTGIALGRNLTGNLIDTTSSSPGWSGEVVFKNPVDAAAAGECVLFRYDFAYQQSGSIPFTGKGSGNPGTATLTQAVRFNFNTGNIARGTLKLWGRQR